ncbi:MAG: hypothetical protein ABWZ41_05475 [Burkholderiales bacterium]
MSQALELIAEHLASSVSGWSIGTYGVLAEFAREAGEPCEHHDMQVVTARGAIRIEANPAAAALAYEVLSVPPGLWHHGVLFSLPDAAAAVPARRAITELGPDRRAVRANDRTAVLFDLGFGSAAFAFCVRTADPALAATLRRAAGTPLLAAGRELASALVAASPHRVAFSRLARIEVYQPIAPEGGATPTGPHTHVLPRLLRPWQSHSANIRLPSGTVPGLTLYPPHPAKDEAGVRKPFSHREHAAFQSLFGRFADPEARAAKAAVVAAVERGEPPARKPATRIGRQAARIALRQLRLAGATGAALATWEQALEPPAARAA